MKFKNFRGLVLFCIDAEFCVQIRIYNFQHFPRSTHSAFFSRTKFSIFRKFSDFSPEFLTNFDKYSERKCLVFTMKMFNFQLGKCLIFHLVFTGAPRPQLGRNSGCKSPAGCLEHLSGGGVRQLRSRVHLPFRQGHLLDVPVRGEPTAFAVVGLEFETFRKRSNVHPEGDFKR